jgi:hypothetical protein
MKTYFGWTKAYFTDTDQSDCNIISRDLFVPIKSLTESGIKLSSMCNCVSVVSFGGLFLSHFILILRQLKGKYTISIYFLSISSTCARLEFVLRLVFIRCLVSSPSDAFFSRVYLHMQVETCKYFLRQFQA